LSEPECNFVGHTKKILDSAIFSVAEYIAETALFLLFKGDR